MNIRANIDFIDFMTNCNVLISKIPRATRNLTEQAGQDILELSNSKVPVETETLKNSGYYEVGGTYRAWDVIVGYADTAHDMVNPVSGKKASEYAVVVHEDLLAGHKIGEAKFLEKAIIEWIQKYPRLARQLCADLGM